MSALMSAIEHECVLFAAVGSKTMFFNEERSTNSSGYYVLSTNSSHKMQHL
jgi:hypothetical protein